MILQYPSNWDRLTPDQKMAVSRGIALEIQKQLGVTPARTDEQATRRRPLDRVVILNPALTSLLTLGG